jgi:HSP20 family protein
MISQDLMVGPIKVLPTGANLPSVNLKETDKKIEIGCTWFEKQDFKVEVENNLLSISSERKNRKRKQ